MSQPLVDRDVGDRRDTVDENPGLEIVRQRVLELCERISALAEGRGGPTEDVGTAHDAAISLKPHIDRLCALRRLLNPVDSIIDKREQIEQLQAGIAADVAEVEHVSGRVADSLEPGLLSQLEGEIASVKRDRKLFVAHGDAEDEPAAAVPRGAAAQRGPGGLLALPVAQRLGRIFGDRFVSAEPLSDVLGVRLDDDQRQACDRQLEVLWQRIFEAPALKPHVERNHLDALQKTFSDYALLFRVTELKPGTACTLAALRSRFNTFFVSASDRSAWYTRLPLYTTPLSHCCWALVDSQYLNCTFKKPTIRLMMYARANELEPRMVRQKSVLEEVYDRIVLQLLLKEPFFASCNSITSTSYQQDAKAPVKQVYVYTRDHTIRISGKQGTPHWRPTRPRWPGVLPSIMVPTRA